VELAVFPSFTALALASEMLSGSPIALGAQNGHPEREGAFTGEVSMHQLADLGVRYVICGHSERRKIFGETDEFVAAKVRAAWAYGITPILCVGETLEERRAGKAWEVVERQLSVALERLSGPLVIAYEPVWAIGTGVPAHPKDAQEMARQIRAWLSARFGEKRERSADPIRRLGEARKRWGVPSASGDSGRACGRGFFGSRELLAHRPRGYRR
jgi:triosephosphate isomerase